MRPIETVNAVIGDESFVATFGRLPAHDDERVATHVGYAARVLRERGISNPRRSELLDALDQYVTTGELPTGESDRGFLPTFLDAKTGVRCAVAHLVEASAGSELMHALDRDHHNDYIADFARDPRFVAWAESSGFTLEELAMIQPGYPPPPPPDILYVVSAEGDLATHDNNLAMVDGSLHYTTRSHSFAGDLTGGVDGKIGIATGSHMAYAVDAKLGGDWHDRELRFDYTAGVIVDEYGPDLPRAWSIPVDLSVELTRDRGAYDALALHGGPRFAVTGDRGVGGNVGLTFRMHDVAAWRFRPNKLVVSFDVNWIGDHTFFGLSVGLGNGRGRSWATE